MNILSYNIWRGGEGRLDKIVTLIKNFSPAIVALQEMNHFDEKKLNELGQQFHLPYTALALGTLTASGNQYHVGTLSRYPIKKSVPLQGFHHACLQTIIESEIGDISLCNAHLHPRSEDERLREIHHIIDAQKNHEKAIICGDLNALTKSDCCSQASRHFFDDELRAIFTKDGMLRSDTTNALAHAGYDDATGAWSCYSHTFPTPLSKRHDGIVQLRVDYIFISQALGSFFKRGYRIGGQDAEKASDHYPVMVMLG